MKLKKKKLLLGIALSLMCSVGVVFAATEFANVSATASHFIGQPLNEYYTLNEKLTIPMATFSAGGQSKTAITEITYPSGKCVSKNEITLDEAGQYTIEYKAVINGELCTETKQFIVKDSLFSTELGSPAYFGSHEYTPDITGIVLSLKNYDVFHFNKIIDLSTMTKDDTLFSMYFTPEIIGANDVNQIDFTFTDIYNPDNYITYTTKIYDAKDGNYSVAYANGQMPAGVQENQAYTGTRPTIFIDGIKHIVHINNDYGAWSRINFIGVSTGGLDIGQERLEVRFDYESRRFYTDHLSCPEVYGKADRLVTDLDDSRLYTTPWEGFTTGEVYMTVSAKKYNAQACNIVITEIAGENLNAGGFEDELAPQITVDYSDFSYGDAPIAKLNESYRIFDCALFDDYTLQPTLTTRVYYNYYTSNKINVAIVDGAFTPKKTGVYTIEYTACDLFGNKQVKTVDVSVSGEAETLSLMLGEGETTGSTGEEVQVKNYTAASSISKHFVQIKAINQDKPGVEYSIDAQTCTFVPMYSGRYTIEYTCSDYVSTIIKTYDVQVMALNSSLIVEEMTSLPKYFIRGCTYTLPVLGAYNFATGEPVEEVAKIYAKTDVDSDYIEVVTGQYLVPQADKVFVKYAATGNEKVYEVPVVDVGYGAGLDIGKYFFGTGFTYQASENMISYIATSNLASMEFINSLLANEFAMSFSTSSLSASFSGLDIYLTDAINPAKTVKFHYYVEGGVTYFTINDSAIYYDVKGKMGDGNSFEFQYNAKKQVVSPYINLEIAIQDYLNGEKFEGFSEKVYLKVEMIGGAGTTFNVEMLNKQVMSSATFDMLEPSIDYTRISGNKELNDIITISPAFASDVLDPNIQFYLKVVNPSKKSVTDENGELLKESYNTGIEHQIKLNEYGRWYIYFYAYDSMGNEAKGTITIVVADTKAPSITVNSAQTEYGLNGQVTIATPTITDNIDSNLEYSVLVYKPNMDVVICTEGTFVADTRGEYIIYYYCMDSYGNVSIESYSIYVR